MVFERSSSIKLTSFYMFDLDTCCDCCVNFHEKLVNVTKSLFMYDTI